MLKDDPCPRMCHNSVEMSGLKKIGLQEEDGNIKVLVVYHITKVEGKGTVMTTFSRHAQF